MKVAIIHYVAGISSKILATALKNNGVHAEVFNINDVGRTNFTDFDHVFAYGCSASTLHKNRINTAQAVSRCVSKPKTFDALKEANVNTVEYCLKKPIPKHWDWVVIRDKIDGRKAEGLNYHENNMDVPTGRLYTEYFEHKYEYRIMVFRGDVVGRYFKKTLGGDWYFNLQPAAGFKEMDDHCIRAAKALGIDYVGVN